jgi:hypothetical protein
VNVDRYGNQSPFKPLHASGYSRDDNDPPSSEGIEEIDASSGEDEISLEKASQRSPSVIKVSGNSHKRKTRWDREMGPTQREIDALRIDLAKLEREYKRQGLTRDGFYKGITRITNTYITILIPIVLCCRRLLHRGFCTTIWI